MNRIAFLVVGFFVLIASTTAYAAGNLDAGKAIFQGHCSECHWTTRLHGDSMGPNLDGFYDKPAASEERYCCYTAALKKAALTWDDATLDKWLSGPAAMVPGTWMAGFPGLKDPQQRADVIAYLSTLK
jgi:cytochrome c